MNCVSSFVYKWYNDATPKIKEMVVRPLGVYPIFLKRGDIPSAPLISTLSMGFSWSWFIFLLVFYSDVDVEVVMDIPMFL